MDITLKNSDAAIKAVRYAVRAAGTWATFVTDNAVTRENVKDYALALAVAAYPSDKPVQKVDGKRTRFGNAVQAAGNGMRAALDKAEPDQAVTDYLARVLKAADAARDHEVDAAAVVAAITAWAEQNLS